MERERERKGGRELASEGDRQRERDRERDREREYAVQSDGAQFAKSTSSYLTQRQSSEGRVFLPHNSHKPPRASATSSGMAVHLLQPPPPPHLLLPLFSLSPSLSLSLSRTTCVMPPWHRVARANARLQTPTRPATSSCSHMHQPNKGGETNTPLYLPVALVLSPSPCLSLSLSLSFSLSLSSLYLCLRLCPAPHHLAQICTPTPIPPPHPPTQTSHLKLQRLGRAIEGHPSDTSDDRAETEAGH